jgi:uncharacterized protein (TIGR00255 family)
VVQTQAPVDRFEQLVRVQAFPAHHRGNQPILLDTAVGGLWCGAGDRGVHRSTDAVDVAPRAEQFALGVMLGRGKARRVHRLEHRRVVRQRLARGTEVDQHRRVVVAHVDVRRLEIEMQQLVRMHLAQAVEQFGEYVAQKILGDDGAVLLDEFLQRPALLVLHDHIDRVVGAEEVEHADHVRMRELGQCATLFEEALHAIAEGRHVLVRDHRFDFTLAAQGQTVGQVLLDRDEALARIAGQIDDRKPAQGELVLNAVFIKLVAGRQGVVCLLRHRYRSYHVVFPAIFGLWQKCVKQSPVTFRFIGTPMIYSMTGYAARTLDVERGALHLELKSVNSRYLDFQFRICEELRVVEPALRELFSARLTRGKLECRLGFAAATSRAQPQTINSDLLERLKSFEDQVLGELPQAAPLSVAEVLRWPGMFGDDSLDIEALVPSCLALAKDALADFSESRAREGAKLAAVILERVERMRELVREVAPRIPAAQQAFQDKLKQRLVDAIGSADDERIRQEVAVFAVRIDVAEELARLSTHLDEVERVLKAGGASGKRLDFLMQELNREANTLGSKSVVTEVSQTAMELKLLIEQMREQIQNLE